MYAYSFTRKLPKQTFQVLEYLLLYNVLISKHFLTADQKYINTTRSSDVFLVSYGI